MYILLFLLNNRNRYIGKTEKRIPRYLYAINGFKRVYSQIVPIMHEHLVLHIFLL